MATRDPITGAWGFHIAPRPLAPARLLTGGDLDALLDRGADVERALSRVAGPLDDFDVEPESTRYRTLATSRRETRRG